GRRRDRIVERRDGRLLELDVEHPDVLAVRDDQLLERLLVMPTESARPLERELARLRLDVVRRRDRLLEVRGERLDLVEKTVEQRAAALVLLRGDRVRC